VDVLPWANGAGGHNSGLHRKVKKHCPNQLKAKRSHGFLLAAFCFYHQRSHNFARTVEAAVVRNTLH
jgi:hypothetical protein